MPITLIHQNPEFDKKIKDQDKLAISEMFADTLQGEGIFTGVVSTFVRLQGCTLQCIWCDTLEVWPNGNDYSFDEIFELFESIDLIQKFKNGQHLILTGGSPLKQQKRLAEFLTKFVEKYDFKPYIEIENEVVLQPNEQMIQFVDCWNNSPKLANSGMKERVRYKPQLIQFMSQLENSWFKFVISDVEDWLELKRDYIDTNLIDTKRIILMPEGDTFEKLHKNREFVAQLAIDNNVRFSDRLHVTIWNQKVGV